MFGKPVMWLEHAIKLSRTYQQELPCKLHWFLEGSIEPATNSALNTRHCGDQRRNCNELEQPSRLGLSWERGRDEHRHRYSI